MKTCLEMLGKSCNVLLLLFVCNVDLFGVVALPVKLYNTRTTGSRYSYETKYFKQELDHFSFGSNATYMQRYLVNASYWKPGDPVFFYTGNEGDITWFCNNTGFMWDIAPRYNAMLVFAEHRYYGESLPFGEDTYKNVKNLSYLSSEQALADFAVLITYLKKQYGYPPFVAFGGSYGGMLSAWLRIKYPHIVIGSIAASAPILQFTGLVDCEESFKIISKRIQSYSNQSAINIRNSWGALTTIARDPGGLEWLQDTFHLCHPLKKDASVLINWLNEVWFDLAEMNYPYNASFLQPLPGWPMKVTCERLTDKYSDNRKLILALANAVQVYFNYTGHVNCLDLSSDATESLGEKGWDYQSCTEMVMPMCSSNTSKDDVFPYVPWVLSDYMEDCVKVYGITPRPYWVETVYGGNNITAASNIVFSNGEYDPWRAGGVTANDIHGSDSLVSLVIKDGGHHVDLRASNPGDTDSIKAARDTECSHIDQWLKNFRNWRQ